jgi:DNA-binding PadR family transcriptional regulator
MGVSVSSSAELKDASPLHQPVRPAAPRGVLRAAILHQASVGIISGVDFSRWVEKITEGVWKPSPGSIYFLLNELESQGFIRTIRKGGRRLYIATEKGRQELRRAQSESGPRFQREFAALLLEATVMNSPLQVEVKNLLRKVVEGGPGRQEIK